LLWRPIGVSFFWKRRIQFWQLTTNWSLGRSCRARPGSWELALLGQLRDRLRCALPPSDCVSMHVPVAGISLLALLPHRIECTVSIQAGLSHQLVTQTAHSPISPDKVCVNVLQWAFTLGQTESSCSRCQCESMTESVLDQTTVMQNQTHTEYFSDGRACLPASAEHHAAANT